MNTPSVQHASSYQKSYSSGATPPLDWQARIGDSAPVIVIIGLVTAYFAVVSTYNIAPRIWHFLVYLAPLRLLLFLDEWLDPAPFPKAPTSVRLPTTHDEKSDILKRILGWNQPSSFLPSLGFLAKNAVMAPSRSKSRFTHPPGLVNRDNSCFQNSILQALASLDNLRTYLNDLVADTDAGALPQLGIAESLSSFVTDLYNPASNGHTFQTPRALKNMNTFWQQDAQEYFTKLVDEVQEDIQKAIKANQKLPGLETDVLKDESSASHHSDDSGYQTQSAASKQSSDGNLSMRMPLEGLSAQRVVCLKCGYSTGLSLNAFQSLTLNLQENLREFHLEDLLSSFTEIENIEGVECHSCTLLQARNKLSNILARVKEDPSSAGMASMFATRLEAVETALEEDDFEDKTLTQRCEIPADQRVSVTKVKQVGIARAPQSLAFHINRSRFDGYTGNTYKILGPVQFPLTLDLGPWSLGGAGCRMVAGASENEKVDGNGGDIEQWQLPPGLSMVAGGERGSKLTGPNYQLRAVIIHQGRHENGHYICYRRHPRTTPAEKEDTNPPSSGEGDKISDDNVEGEQEGQDGYRTETETEKEPEELSDQWWRISDETVREADEEEVLAQGGVFMLFYDRVDPNSVFVPSLPFDNGLLALAGISVGDTNVPDQEVDEPMVDAPESLETNLDPALFKPVVSAPHIEPENPTDSMDADDIEVDSVSVTTEPASTESYSRESTPASITSEDTAVESVATETTVADLLDLDNEPSLPQKMKTASPRRWRQNVRNRSSSGPRAGSPASKIPLPLRLRRCRDLRRLDLHRLREGY